MTCKPVPGHPLDALYQAARRYPGGIEALAHRLKISEPTLYKKLRHQCDTHHLAYDGELSEILFCLEDAQIAGWADTLHALCWRHGHLAILVPVHEGGTAGEITAAIVESVKEHAEAIQAIGDSLKRDAQIDAGELLLINKQIEEAMVALVALKDLAQRKHEADFPVVGRDK
jgi:hypothetical protein